MAALYTNNASTILASGITNSATSLTVQTGNGAKFPNPTSPDYFMCTLQGVSGTPIEIIKVTARSTDTFTIVRAQEGTTASAFNANDIVELRVTAGEMGNLPQLNVANTFTQNQTIYSGALTLGSTPIGAGNSSIMKNRIINGAMVIDQRNAGASVTPATDATYTLDRWSARLTQSSKYSVQQNAGSVTPPAGFTKYLGVTSLSAYSVGTSDFFAMQQIIEGFNVADLGWGTANAKPITISFLAYSSLTGTFGGSVYNNGGTRNYPFSYSIPVANTWTTISVTIAGDTSGTWITTNTGGLYVQFGLGVGSTYSGTAGSWSGTNYLSATGATSVVGTSGATFYITGVQLEVGSSATGFEYVNYQTSLANCQRYYAKSYATGTAPATAYTAGSSGVSLAVNLVPGMGTGFTLPVTLRAAPTLTVYDAAGTSAKMTYYSGGWTNGGAILTSYADTQQGFAQVTPTSTAISFHYTVSAEL